jgi:hypothetical protein
MNKPNEGEGMGQYIKRVLTETNNGYSIQMIINNYNKFKR